MMEEEMFLLLPLEAKLHRLLLCKVLLLVSLSSSV